MAIAPNKFNSDTTKDYEFLLFNVSKFVAKKILFYLNVRKAENMKEAADVLFYPLPTIINLSVKKLFVFPEECKIAKVKPLFKKGSKVNPSHRTISLLPLASKSIQKSIHYQLQDYFKDNGLLCK